jgi:hypothetical protein
MVDIVRDFLVAHQELSDLFLAFEEGRLHFEDVHRLVGDDGASVLFRLKERCHAIFRASDEGSVPEMRREALFDLAVGSLFHEAMKLRENLYQQEFYVPRVRDLRAAGAEEEAGEILEEFAKILAISAARLEEAVNETRILLTQTRQQLRLLMADHRENGPMARCLYEEEQRVSVVFEEGLDGLYTRIFGSPFEGFMVVARSYLDSAYFAEALAALGDARSREDGRGEIHHLVCYAEGMQAFLNGAYGQSVERLRDWLDGGLEEGERAGLELALGAVSSVPNLVEGEAREALLDDAKQLSDRLKAETKSGAEPAAEG